MMVVKSSLDVAVEDLAPSSSLCSRPIRWISFTFVRLIDFQFGSPYPTFQAFFVQGPFFHLFFFFLYCLANIMFCSCCGTSRMRWRVNRKGGSPFIVFTELFLMNNEITTNWSWGRFYLLRYEDEGEAAVAWFRSESVSCYRVSLHECGNKLKNDSGVDVQKKCEIKSFYYSSDSQSKNLSMWACRHIY